MGFNFCNLYFIISILSIFSKKSVGTSRSSISTTLDYSHCPNNIRSEPNLYIKAYSTTDVLHFLFMAGSLTKFPSVLIIRSTDLSSNLSLNCAVNEKTSDFINKNGTNFTSTFGLIFMELFEYSYYDLESGKPPCTRRKWSFDKFDWKIKEINSSSVSFRTSSLISPDKLFCGNDSEIELQFFYKNSSNLWPYSSDNCHFNLTLKNLTKVSEDSIFAVQFALINGNSNDKMNKSIVYGKSPEFWITNFYGQLEKENSMNNTYLQWKSVWSYSDSQKQFANINESEIKLLNHENTKIKNLASSLVYRVMENKIIQSNSSASYVIITFHTYKYYNSSNWSASFGYGSPPIYKSNNGTVTIVIKIIIGCTLPVMLTIVLSIYYNIEKRLNNKKKGMYISLN